jgi:PAB-dependent poly(A)-specific ribonuclease subunit 3
MGHDWSETGDRYLLKLFYDYVFHSVTDDGRPFIDMAHIIQCLNKVKLNYCVSVIVDYNL